MKFDEKNLIVDNVLTKNEIDEIYESLNVAYKTYVMETYGQKISDFRLPESVLNKIVSISENISGVSGLILEAYQFSRYEKFTKPDGTISSPVLTPHYDDFSEPRFTFDYQIRSNTSWPLVVEDEQFTLADNQALTFSGTHQVHWRSNKTFADGEFIDMLFCHLHLPESDPNPETHREIMTNKKDIFASAAGIKGQNE